MSGHHLRLKDFWRDNRLGGDIGSRAWLVLDDERLAEPLREPLTNETRGYVGRAASQETDNNAHRPRHAMRDRAGSAAAPAARCKNVRRGSFILNLPSRHSITSSARASSVGGTSRPSALAVFRFITSSYLV